MSAGSSSTANLNSFTSVLSSARRHSRVLTAAVILSLAVMWSFFRAPLTPWQHRFLAHEVSLSGGRIDAIVVLGYAVDHDAGVVTAPLASRLEQAFHLLCHSRTADTVVLTGGCSWAKADTLPSEAEVMRRWLTARWQGKPLPQTADSPALTPSPCTRPLPLFILESASTSTQLNAVLTLKVLEEGYPDIGRLLLVTNRFHQWRAWRVFEKAVEGKRKGGEGRRWEVGMSGMERDVFDERVTQWDWWRELAAIVYYRMRGYI